VCRFAVEQSLTLRMGTLSYSATKRSGRGQLALDGHYAGTRGLGYVNGLGITELALFLHRRHGPCETGGLLSRSRGSTVNQTRAARRASRKVFGREAPLLAETLSRDSLLRP